MNNIHSQKKRYNKAFMVTIFILLSAPIDAASWQVFPQATRNYSILRSDNEPGIGIKSAGFFGLNTTPRYTIRFNPANIQLVGSGETYGHWFSPGTYHMDAFIKEAAPFSRPLLRFMYHNSLPAVYVPNRGFKKQSWSITTTELYGRYYQLSPEFFPTFSTRQSTAFTLRSCWTRTDYNANTSECINTLNAVGIEQPMIYKKAYDFVFNQRAASANILIDSDGSTHITGNATGCRAITVNNSSGISCHLFDYLPRQYFNDLDARQNVGYGLFISDSRLNSLDRNDVLVSSNNGSTWTGLEQGVNLTNAPIRNDNIHVFFSSSFFKKIGSIGLDSFDLNRAFYLGLSRNITNLNHIDITLPISSSIKILPRTVSATITSRSSGYLEGDIGKGEITFPYTIQESGPTSAERLEISISQDRGVPAREKCTFYPPDQTSINFGVPIDTYLSFDTTNNGKVRREILCNNKSIELRQLGIKDSRPPVNNINTMNIPSITRFYDVDLVFDLMNGSGELTSTGENWQGKVEQTGKITFKATWN
ncbi:TPA: hypothetical protein RQM99_002407 [Aeromonas dhakensis]|uniref:hypothetical protein n=1 Tax=Aeromonas dhakensis TaxID=196024 RepID=UPI0028902CBC|nr:hypothetical protein [Aeromonas dhakensis]